MTLDQLQEYCLANDCFAVIDGDRMIASLHPNCAVTVIGDRPAPISAMYADLEAPIGAHNPA